MAEITGYAPRSVGASMIIIGPAIANKLIGFPDNPKNSFRPDGARCGETSLDEKTNTAQLIER